MIDILFADIPKNTQELMALAKIHDLFTEGNVGSKRITFNVLDTPKISYINILADKVKSENSIKDFYFESFDEFTIVVYNNCRLIQMQINCGLKIRVSDHVLGGTIGSLPIEEIKQVIKEDMWISYKMDTWYKDWCYYTINGYDNMGNLIPT